MSSANNKINVKFLKITIILFGVISTLCWILIIPYNDANDEYLHYGLAKFIADQRSLPIYNRDDYAPTACDRIKIYQFGKIEEVPVCHSSYSATPFPSYLISALFIAPIPKNAPYRYMFARIPNIIYFSAFLLLAWNILKKAFSSESIRYMALASVAFIPQMTFINAYVNSDSFSLMISAIVVYVWFKVADEGMTRKNIILGAIAMGLLASAKYNYFVLFPATAIFIPFSFKRFGWKKILKFFSAAAAGVIIISGGWFFRNYILYGDALGLATIKNAVLAIAPDVVSLKSYGFTFWTTLLATNWGILSFKSFFATFGWMSIYLPNIFYWVIYLLINIALFGWLFRIIGFFAKKRINDLLGSKYFPLAAAFLVAIIGSISLSVWTSLNNDFQPQGRYLFSALLPIMIGIIKGLQYFGRMIKINEKILLATFSGWITITWLFSYLMLIFYYEMIRTDADIHQYFYYYEKMIFIIHNDFLRISLLTGGTIVLIFFILKIWKNILRNFNVS